MSFDRFTSPIRTADELATIVGTVTGAAAGTVLGLVSGWFLPLLDDGEAHRGGHVRYRPEHGPGRSR